jgi:hypothetical protein
VLLCDDDARDEVLPLCDAFFFTATDFFTAINFCENLDIVHLWWLVDVLDSTPVQGCLQGPCTHRVLPRCKTFDHPLAGSAASIFIGGYCDPKGAGLFCGPFLRKGEVSAYVGLIQNLNDL